MHDQPAEPEARSESFRFALAPTIAGEVRRQPEHRLALLDYLARALGRPVELVVEESYATTLAALREGRLDAAMMGEVASQQAEEGGGIEPLLAPTGSDGTATYQSAIITRIDSGIHDLTGLRGVTLGLVDEQSTSGYLVPRAMLREAGLDPDRDTRITLFGHHRAVIEAVIAGDVTAGAVHAGRLKPPSLDRGPDYARLRILATSQPIPLGPLVVRADLDDPTRSALVSAMLRVHEADPAAAEYLLRAGLRFTLVTRRSTPTLKSIAALAGVSYATVSRVVNGTGYVAPETAARVGAIVRELGYRPNGNALSLQGGQAPLVGLVMPPRPDDASPEVANLAERLQAELAAAGVPLVLCPVAGPLGASLVLDLVRDGRLGALVVTSEHVGDPDLAEIARTGRAVVAVGVAGASPGVIVTSPTTAAEVVLGALNLAPPRSRIGIPG